MKTRVKTFMIIVVFSLVMKPFSVAETSEIEAENQRNAVTAETQKKVYGSLMKTATAKDDGSNFLLLTSTRPPQESPGFVDTGSVLVIPAEEIKTEELIKIKEDMSVMSRIFDKKLGYENTVTPSLSFSQMYFPGFGGSYFSHSISSTQGLYLDGYGALFLMQVSFPLLPTPTVQEKEQVKEPNDPLWEKTKQEIYNPEGRNDISIDKKVEEYDSEKVENLKRDLLKTLKHANNIRRLKPDEWIILTVRERQDLNDGRTYRRRITLKTDKSSGNIIYDPMENKINFPAQAVMTVRVKKSEVDSFAKGELSFNEFREQVSIYTYPD